VRRDGGDGGLRVEVELLDVQAGVLGRGDGGEEGRAERVGVGACGGHDGDGGRCRCQEVSGEGVADPARGGGR